ncbi:MAG: hypothetical protein ABUS49_07160, partial [Acidobacteriota bacterium]
MVAAVEGITSGVTPRDLASVFRRAARESCVQPHDTIPNKSLTVMRGEARIGNIMSLGGHPGTFSEWIDWRAGEILIPVSCLSSPDHGSRGRFPCSGPIAPDHVQSRKKQTGECLAFSLNPARQYHA